MKGKRISQEIISVAFLIFAVVLLFFWYTSENSRRIEERNKTYAEDSAQQTAQRIEGEFANAILRVRNYAYLLGAVQEHPAIDASSCGRWRKTPPSTPSAIPARREWT